MSDLRNDAWFSGFADGEACFYISRQQSGLIVPRFCLALRADDGEILTRLSETFGGAVYWQPPAPSVANASPQYHWRVTSKRDLANLVDYFDRFPLRAKKARDFKLWRVAVTIYCCEGGRDGRLEELRQALATGRAFDAEHSEPALIPMAQMAFDA